MEQCHNRRKRVLFAVCTSQCLKGKNRENESMTSNKTQVASSRSFTISQQFFIQISLIAQLATAPPIVCVFRILIYAHSKFKSNLFPCTSNAKWPPRRDYKLIFWQNASRAAPVAERLAPQNAISQHDLISFWYHIRSMLQLPKLTAGDLILKAPGHRRTDGPFFFSLPFSLSTAQQERHPLNHILLPPLVCALMALLMCCSLWNCLSSGLIMEVETNRWLREEGMWEEHISHAVKWLDAYHISASAKDFD